MFRLRFDFQKVGIQKCADGDVDLPLDYSITHPLQNTWTLWFFENDRNNSWEENQKEIASFNTVEDFWRLVFAFPYNCDKIDFFLLF